MNTTLTEKPVMVNYWYSFIVLVSMLSLSQEARVITLEGGLP